MSLSPGDNPPARNRLEELGYEQQLRRRLKVWHVVGLSLADVSPTMAVLFLTAGGFFVGGAFGRRPEPLLGGGGALLPLCLSALAALYPVVGGVYMLGPPGLRGLIT